MINNLNKLKTNKGFSLVELMVVVGIISILTLIAVPRFEKFSAKAKQSSAKAELTGLYTAQKAFFVENSTYYGDLPAIGFEIESGARRYHKMGFNVDSSTTPLSVAAANVATNARVAGWDSYTAATSNGILRAGGMNWSTAGTGTKIVAADTTITNTAFSAAAEGTVCGTQPNGDRWKISEDKRLEQIHFGC